jgi:2-polyprenyl-3-methyl-5-hydroxy-6-metoxy-1,4-benzoquinol methylase
MVCPICRADDSVSIVGPQKRWRYQRCVKCEHRWLAPIPDERELAQHYNSAYAVMRENYISQAADKARELTPIIKAASAQPGRMLEIGCSYGALLKAFQDQGWQADGVEIDGRAAEFARSQYGLNVIEGTLEQTQAMLRPPYDVVMMYHVVEHIVDPLAFCRLVRTMMSDRGVLVLKTPNATSTASRRTGGWWEWALAPEHVHLYSPTSLEMLLRQTGFALRDAVTRRGDATPAPYQLAQAAVKRLIGVDRRGSAAIADSGVAPPALRSFGWYRIVDGAARAVMTPANLAFAAAARFGVVSESELLVTADAR